MSKRFLTYETEDSNKCVVDGVLNCKQTSSKKKKNVFYRDM